MKNGKSDGDQHEVMRVEATEHVETHEEVECYHTAINFGDRPTQLPPRRARRAMLAQRIGIVLGVLFLLGLWMLLIRICVRFFTG